MKKKVFLFLLFFIVACNNKVFAINEYTNFYNITMSDEQKNNLIDLGFSEEQIYYMEEEEFDKNKNLQGIIVSEDTKYIKSTYIYKNNDLSLNNRIINFNSLELINVINEEVTEEEYNNSDSTSSTIVLNDVNPSIIETTYKKLTTKITYISSTNRYRFRNDLVWKNMPSNRSYDVFGIALNNSVAEVVSGSQYFKTTYKKYDACLMSTTTSTITSASWKKGGNGYALSFKLPSNTSKTYSWNTLTGNPYPCNDNDPFPGNSGSKTVTQNVTSLSSYMYYDVVKIGSTSPLSAYGSYQHSVKSISLDLSLSFEVNINGSVGGVFSMSASVSEKFDKMSGTHAQILNPVW